jgi:hypothetical protein
MRRSLRAGVTAAVTALALAGATLIMTNASANEPLPEGPATLQDFVRASVPEWNFAFAVRNAPCWPEDAWKNGKPHPGTSAKAWPDSDGGCIYKGAEQNLPFPTYYTVQKCTSAEIRVTFTLYMARSGFSIGGHKHDFEHIDVVWKRTGTEWRRDKLLLSRHAGHETRSWATVESWNAGRTSAGLGREFPRIFVGWGSHAMFNNQGGLTDLISQLTANEYRHADYPSFADRAGMLVEVAPGGAVHQRFQADDPTSWDGTATPARNADTACSHT